MIPQLSQTEVTRLHGAVGVSDAGGAATQPQGETEEKVAAIISSLLNVPRVGREDNFFDLGGHSLLAVMCFNEIDRVFGKRLPPATLFGAQTVEQIARTLNIERAHS